MIEFAFKRKKLKWYFIKHGVICDDRWCCLRRRGWWGARKGNPASTSSTRCWPDWTPVSGMNSSSMPWEIPTSSWRLCKGYPILQLYVLYEANLLESNIYDNIACAFSVIYNMICCDKCIHQNKSFSHRIGWQLSRNNILWLNWSWSTGMLNRKIVIDFLLCVRFKWISNIKTSILFLQEWRSSKSCRFMEQDL